MPFNLILHHGTSPIGGESKSRCIEEWRGASKSALFPPSIAAAECRARDYGQTPEATASSTLVWISKSFSNPESSNRAGEIVIQTNERETSASFVRVPGLAA